MITALILGTGLGIGLWMLVAWAVPARPPLRLVLARLNDVPAPLTADPPGLVGKLGAPAVELLRALGLPGDRLRRDLAVLSCSINAHLAEKAVFAGLGFLLAMLVQLVLVTVGTNPGLAFPITAGLVLAVIGFVLPDARVRARAGRLRAEVRHALSSFLDLVWISLAGGAGVDSALVDSAAVGQGWVFDQIRRALDTAKLTRTTPWSALRQLGRELDISELAELAASISLAGTEGAKVRASLAAKAAALRAHQISDAEAEAQSATERMTLPVMALLLGFLAFIAFPALIQVINGL